MVLVPPKRRPFQQHLLHQRDEKRQRQIRILWVETLLVVQCAPADQVFVVLVGLEFLPLVAIAADMMIIVVALEDLVRAEHPDGLGSMVQLVRLVMWELVLRFVRYAICAVGPCSCREWRIN